MTDVAVEYAEEKFVANEVEEAAEIIAIAKSLDPYYVNIDKYVAVYEVHAAALHKISGWVEPNWCKVLGWMITSHMRMSSCTAFAIGAKLIDPDNNTSAAAPGAYRLISMAIEILGNSSNRAQFHRRLGSKSPQVHMRELRTRCK